MKTLTKTAIILTAISSILFFSCKKDKVVTIPVVTTDSVFNVGPNVAQFNGSIVSNGGAAISTYGVCWSTSHNPTIIDNKASFDNPAGNDINGSYFKTIDKLSATTTYYARAFATNNTGTGYGEEVSFTTGIGTVVDNEGNVYKIVLIGKNLWLAENLKTRHYNNGDTIPTTYPQNKDITDENEPKYQWPCNGDTSLIKTYGRLYTWYVVSDSRGVCPTGWHVPTFSEFNTLGDLNKLKETGTKHWQTPNKGADNSNGFTALPAGIRGYDNSFFPIGTYARFWLFDANINNYIAINSNGDIIDPNTKDILYQGESVRCLKNQ